jgi:hypothetical protein
LQGRSHFPGEHERCELYANRPGQKFFDIYPSASKAERWRAEYAPVDAFATMVDDLLQHLADGSLDRPLHGGWRNPQPDKPRPGA